jgi:hypothetical protein
VIVEGNPRCHPELPQPEALWALCHLPLENVEKRPHQAEIAPLSHAGDLSAMPVSAFHLFSALMVTGGRRLSLPETERIDLSNPMRRQLA